jgi:hypothetical protein
LKHKKIDLFLNFFLNGISLIYKWRETMEIASQEEKKGGINDELRTLIKSNILKRLNANYPLTQVFAEYGLKLDKMHGCSLSYLVEMLVERIILYQTYQKIKKTKPVKFEFVEPAEQQIVDCSPQDWMVLEKAAKFVGCSKSTCFKLYQKNSEKFEKKFPDQQASKKIKEESRYNFKRHIEVYNPLLLGYLKLYWLQGYSAVPQGYKSADYLAAQYNVDFQTVNRIVLYFAEINPELVHFGKSGGSKPGLYCSPKLIELLDQLFKYSELPSFKINNFGWMNGVGITKKRTCEKTISRIVDSYRISNPELIICFRLKGKRLVEYFHPLLVAIIFGKIKNIKPKKKTI